MPYRALVSVDGYDFPEPSIYSGNTATLVDSGRNVEGRFIGSVVRDDVAKVDLTWNYLTIQQWANINKKFKRSAGGKFINLVDFFDQSVGGWVTKEMYISDRNAGLWRRDPDTGDVLGWVGAKLSLVEV
ncbi:MAG: hypothetical protein WHF31_16350 [Candidatus Dehalobacter alkaniphilus]